MPEVGATPEFSPERVKHLELIQAVIARLGNDSFLVKGWAVTIGGVFLGLAVSSSTPGLALVSLGPTALFWGLDTYYLRSERLFRAFYERARIGGADYVPFAMDGASSAFVASLSASDRKRLGWRCTFWRPTLRWLYLALSLAAVLVFALGPEKPTSHSCSPKLHANAVGDFHKRC